MLRPNRSRSQRLRLGRRVRPLRRLHSPSPSVVDQSELLFAEKSGLAMPPDSVRSVDSDNPNTDPVHSGLVVWSDPVDTGLPASHGFGSDPGLPSKPTPDYWSNPVPVSRLDPDICVVKVLVYRIQTLDFRVGYPDL